MNDKTKKKTVEKDPTKVNPRDIKTGWDRLDKEKQDKLRAMGIHPLRNTPGKLLTARGAIPGVLGSFGTVWGKMSWTGDKAEANMGFRPKEGSIGVQLNRRRYVDNNGKVKSGIFATSLMRRYVVPTEKEKSVWDRTAILGKMASKCMRDIIYPIWEPLVINKNRKPWTGYHYFESVNHTALGHSIDWSKLVISKGKLPRPTKVCSSRYLSGENKIEIIHPLTVNRKPLTKNQLGIGIVDSITGDFFHISPTQIAEEATRQIKACETNPTSVVKGKTALKDWNLVWDLKQIRKYYRSPKQKKGWVPRAWSRFYMYMYHKEGKNYSDSISSRIDVARMDTDDKRINTEKKGLRIVVEVLEGTGKQRIVRTVTYSN
ncbi:MAG: hypothetical protein WC614_11990 [bacterium]